MFWKAAKPSSSAAGRGYSYTILDHTNLDRFLDTVTPRLPLHSIPQRGDDGISSNGVLPVGDEPVPYFTLADLWQGFDEASAIGVGTRVLFDNGDLVTQYYTPLLSAVQLFTNKPYISARCDSDISWSDDNESEKRSRSICGSSSPTWESSSDSTAYVTSSSSSAKRGHEYLNYCEFASPFWRVPFYEKILELSQARPELMTLKSSHLSPSSWLAVLWYPIYNIPSQKRSKDLSTTFLTFYSLSSISLGDQVSETAARKNLQRQKSSKKPKSDMIYLRPFGLSTFRLSGNTWTTKESDVEKMSSLQNAADSWLKQLSFFHHDFSFYLTQLAEGT